MIIDSLEGPATPDTNDIQMQDQRGNLSIPTPISRPKMEKKAIVVSDSPDRSSTDKPLDAVSTADVLKHPLREGAQFVLPARKFGCRSPAIKTPKQSRRRRKAADLASKEKWYCPYGCGKVYRKNSTLSIRKHRKECNYYFFQSSSAPYLTWNSNVCILPNVPQPDLAPVNIALDFARTLYLTSPSPLLQFPSPLPMQTLAAGFGVPPLQKPVQYEPWSPPSTPAPISNVYFESAGGTNFSCSQPFRDSHVPTFQHCARHKNYPLPDSTPPPPTSSLCLDSTRLKFHSDTSPPSKAYPDLSPPAKSYPDSSQFKKLTPLIPSPRRSSPGISVAVVPHCVIQRPTPLRVTVKDPIFLSSFHPRQSPI